MFRAVPHLERSRHLCLVLRQLQLSPGVISAFNSGAERALERGWRATPSQPLMGFPGPLSLAVGREEGEFYLAHDLFLPLVDVSKKQQMISVLLLC